MPSERWIVYVHFILQGEIRPQRDSHPILSNTSQLIAGMELSDH